MKQSLQSFVHSTHVADGCDGDDDNAIARPDKVS